MKDRCEPCPCASCRWRGAGSLCHYNEHGDDGSSCSWCVDHLSGRELIGWYGARAGCRGYQERAGVSNGID